MNCKYNKNGICKNENIKPGMLNQYGKICKLIDLPKAKCYYKGEKDEMFKMSKRN